MPDPLASASSMVLALYVLGFFSSLTVFALAIGFRLERALGRTKKIFAMPFAKGQRRFELVGNLVFVSVATVAVSTALKLGIVRFGPPSLVRHVATFWALLVGFQAFYWTLHRAMHMRHLLFVHRWHHRSHVTTVLSGQSMSVGESLLWMLGYVGLPALYSLVVPISFEGWAAYLAFNVIGNVVGHASVEITARPFASRTAALFSNPLVYHALHHARWRENFGFGAAWMDRLFGTESEDWPRVYERVTAGRPLTRLNERDAP
ncbi:MAG: Sterol desaturase family protein [Myxococcaceae bacterium]|nr:Sterol desaturase family protein [Myxococcaceae bacterium]